MGVPIAMAERAGDVAKGVRRGGRVGDRRGFELLVIEEVVTELLVQRVELLAVASQVGHERLSAGAATPCAVTRRVHDARRGVAEVYARGAVARHRRRDGPRRVLAVEPAV